MVIYAIYVFFCKNSTLEKYVNSKNNKSVVLLKTHIWNDDIEKFASKIRSETINSKVDFFILIHCENPETFNTINNKELKQHVLIFREKDINKIYRKGFFGMWLSNHWITMWFYKQFKNNYQYFWTIEYDVRISGNGSILWEYSGNEDFLFPIEPFKDSNWGWKNHYVGDKLTDENKYYGYLQLARYSNKFLEYLDKHFENGENGQDELIIFSLFKRGNFTGSKNLLDGLINNSWSVIGSESDKHKNILKDHEKKSLRIYHPIKNG